MTELALSGLNRLASSLPRLRSAWGAIVLVLAAIAVLDPGNMAWTIDFTVKALLSTLPYIIVAVLMIAALKATSAEHTIARVFEGREYRMIIMAALIGGLAPFCSCEVIPFVAGLIAAGAPLSAIMAFWLSSPLIDPPTLFITAGALGWNFAIAKAIFAVGIGLFGGFITAFMTRGGMLKSPAKPGSVADNCSCGPGIGSDKPVWKFWQEGGRISIFREQFLYNALFLLKWLTLAYLLEALLIHYVPAKLIGGLVGGEGVQPIVISALLGAPAYLNSYVAPPLVAGLMEQGMSAGAGMAFMIAGAVSCIPAVVGIYSLVRIPVLATYFLLGLIGSILSGLLFILII